MDLFFRIIASTGVVITSIMALVLAEAIKKAIKVFRIIKGVVRSFMEAAARIREKAVASVVEEVVNIAEPTKNSSIVATDIDSLG